MLWGFSAASWRFVVSELVAVATSVAFSTGFSATSCFVSGTVAASFGASVFSTWAASVAFVVFSATVASFATATFSLATAVLASVACECSSSAGACWVVATSCVPALVWLAACSSALACADPNTKTAPNKTEATPNLYFLNEKRSCLFIETPLLF